MALALLAATAVAWLVIQYENARRTERGKQAALEPGSSPATIRAGLSAARAAGTLNPDISSRRVYEAVLEARSGDFPAAVRTMTRLVHDEPEDAESWFLLSRVSEDVDPALSRRALARVRQLDPLFDRPRTPRP